MSQTTNPGAKARRNELWVGVFVMAGLLALIVLWLRRRARRA